MLPPILCIFRRARRPQCYSDFRIQVTQHLNLLPRQPHLNHELVPLVRRPLDINDRLRCQQMVRHIKHLEQQQKQKRETARGWGTGAKTCQY